MHSPCTHLLGMSIEGESLLDALGLLLVVGLETGEKHVEQCEQRRQGEENLDGVDGHLGRGERLVLLSDCWHGCLKNGLAAAAPQAHNLLSTSFGHVDFLERWRTFVVAIFFFRNSDGGVLLSIAQLNPHLVFYCVL